MGTMRQSLSLPLLLAPLAIFPGPARVVAFDGESPPAVDRTDETWLTVAGTVLMPDGSPAPGATVELAAEPGEPPGVARADGSGRFRLRGMFGNGARLHASSADGGHQATLYVSSVACRTAFATPVELRLEPAADHEVTVLAGDRPVEGAHVAATGIAFSARGVSGPDGKARLRLPARERLQEVVAWQRDLGVRGVRGLDDRPARDTTQLTLLPPGPLTLCVVDPDGRPVAGMELGVNVFTEDSDWAVASGIVPARVRTLDDGTVRVPWAPAENLKYVEARIVDPGWKVDETDLERIGDRVVTVHARRKLPVEGRLVMPEGASAEGLLITGFGFGPGTSGDIPYARARADGRFTLRVPSDHAYVLGVADLRWASDAWSGMILGKETWKPAEITLAVQRATPVSVSVTRGQQRVPVADAWVEVGSSAEVDWVDAGGKKRSGNAGVHSWLRTDGSGVARAGAGRGKFGVRLSSGHWGEDRTIVVSSAEPVEVEFHRDWLGERRARGRLIDDGRPFEPSPTLMALAWTPRSPYLPLRFRPEVAPDGTFRVEFDAETLSLFFNDPEKRRSGFSRLGPEESSVEVPMVPMAAYGGTLLDEDARPMSGQDVSLSVKDSGGEAIATQRTDDSGRFRFAAVPAGVPLVLSLDDEASRQGYYLFGGDRMFEPGEAREGDEVRRRRAGSPAPAARPKLPLGDRVEEACNNVRASGMRALVILEGDDSQGVAALTGHLLDYDKVDAVLRYLPVRVEAAELEAEAATLDKSGWPRPSPGQVVLVALDGDRATIATETIQADGTDAAPGLGEAFLRKHAPPARDALASLAAARDEARESGRRVWVVIGGPRCGPCFRLGRWIEEHHAALEKDFVIVKVMSGLDEHSAEVVRGLPIGDGDGIPWHAITEPDGTILATSHGPLGNIGFPGSVEGARHFRRMLDRTARRLTPAEVDGLVGSLSPKP